MNVIGTGTSRRFREALEAPSLGELEVPGELVAELPAGEISITVDLLPTDRGRFSEDSPPLPMGFAIRATDANADPVPIRPAVVPVRDGSGHFCLLGTAYIAAAGPCRITAPEPTYAAGTRLLLHAWSSEALAVSPDFRVDVQGIERPEAGTARIRLRVAMPYEWDSNMVREQIAKVYASSLAKGLGLRRRILGRGGGARASEANGDFVVDVHGLGLTDEARLEQVAHKVAELTTRELGPEGSAGRNIRRIYKLLSPT